MPLGVLDDEDLYWLTAPGPEDDEYDDDECAADCECQSYDGDY